MQQSKRRAESSERANRTVVWRTIFLMVLCGVVVFVPLIAQLYKIQINEHDFYERQAIDQQTRDTVIAANRGTIYDRNRKQIAVSAPVETIALSPVDIEDEDQAKLIAEGLSMLLDVDYDKVYELTQKSNYYQLVARKVEKEQADKVRDFKERYGLRAIRIDPDTKRYYTYSNLASQLLGFVGIDNQGLEGLEAYYDEKLTGTPGKIVTAKNNAGTDMPFQHQKFYDPEDGLSMVLTIDETMQHFLEKHLEQAIVENQVENRATGIIMDVKTGEILAMATSPGYDLNDPRTIVDEETLQALSALEGDAYREALAEAQLYQWRNKAVSDTYEPGSVFKVVTLAMALEEGAKTLESKFYCDGSAHVPGWGKPISCWKKAGHGSQTLAETLQNSCNPAFIDIGLSIGREKFYEYQEAFGFGKRTGVDMPGEAAGLLHDKAAFMTNDVDLAVAAFGQRFTVTPLQMVTAVSAVVNGGYLMEPHIVKEFIDSEGNVVQAIEPTVVRQVISEETSAIMCDLMEKVVSIGTGKNARVNGYNIGGKTGTSEKAGANTEGMYDVSFVGVAPTDDPQIVILVILDTPGGPAISRSGGIMAAPLAGRILADVLPYMGIEPQYSEEELKGVDVSMPNLNGMTREAAEAALKEKGFTFKFEGDGETVTDQVPAHAAKVPNTSQVIVYMGGAKPSGLVAVPDVIGLSPEEANRALTNAGLYVRSTGPASGGTVKAALQSIDAGTQVVRGTVVDVEFRDMAVGDDVH
ncbi:PASTA domain-containing protein [Oscillospiraceae bacterium OttesenSCG-928-F05]|nr:PASTA domain-containing protein [Oscillospiraceae bacterium OttesenSCG-928-F05]